ncbi:MAG: DUF4136 domain-containing protein [Planctomycetes bacterium]|nr:DUF4136 domain-containing protein [Planctomycetota bacterium]
MTHERSCATVRGLLPRISFGVFLFLSTGCSSIETEAKRERPFTTEGITTYAWATAPSLMDLEGTRVEDPELEAAVRRAVDAELGRRGMHEVSHAEAAWLITQNAAVTVKVRANDPYFAFNAADQVEEGAIQLHVLDGRTRRVLWSGIGKSPLRVVGRGTGLHRQEFTAVDGERDWSVPEKVRAILAELLDRDRS